MHDLFLWIGRLQQLSHSHQELTGTFRAFPNQSETFFEAGIADTRPEMVVTKGIDPRNRVSKVMDHTLKDELDVDPIEWSQTPVAPCLVKFQRWHETQSQPTQ